MGKLSVLHDRRDEVVSLYLNTGLSLSQIGERFGVNKNVIVGIIGRMRRAGKIPGRPEQEPKPKVVAPVRSKPVKERPKPELKVAQKPNGVVFKPLSTKPCCWPLWDDQPDGRFCGAPAEAGYPYCPEHKARAYGAPRMKLEEYL